MRRGIAMEDAKVFDVYFELPDGYQVQLMVLQDFPGGRPKRGARMTCYRSRIWIGHAEEPEPLTHRSQEHPDLRVAIDACYSMVLSSAHGLINSPLAISELQLRTHAYFSGSAQVI